MLITNIQGTDISEEENIIIFKNKLSGEESNHIEFVTFVWEEAERQFDECHDDIKWYNLTKLQQIEQYCYQYEHQINDMDWGNYPD